MPNFDDDVLALDITKVPQPLKESPPHIRGLRLGRRENADSSDPHRWLRLRDHRRGQETKGAHQPPAPIHQSIPFTMRRTLRITRGRRPTGESCGSTPHRQTTFPIRDRLHSITWLARARTDGEILRPSVLAVFRLRTNSFRMGCSIGRSAGRAPRSTLSAYSTVASARPGSVKPYD